MKIGCTQCPIIRLSTYNTGCPPGLQPSHDIEYIHIYETNASTMEELYDYEEEVHERFLQFRMMRERPGDTEWFNFSTREAYEMVDAYVSTREWMTKRIQISDLEPVRKPVKSLGKNYHKNLKFLKTRSLRNNVLSVIQKPVINVISEFISNPDDDAGYVISPCGSGKTMMTVKGIIGVKRCVICCPSRQIQNQWVETIINEGVFSSEDIYIIGGSGTTDMMKIATILQRESYCVITTNMSSHLLVDHVTINIELIIIDEAHHMAGVVSKEDTGEGRTRRLIAKCVELGLKRLSLTYTPRFIVDTEDCDIKFFTMDDEEVFGRKICELKYRELIQQGVLPDFRLWMLRDEGKKGQGIVGKTECLLEAWRATEFVRGVERHILDHLVVFTSTIKEALIVEEMLRERTTETLVIRVEEGHKLEKPIKDFTEAKRAILVNCFVLNEGVDIPIANSVAIMYPKKSRGQITQMVLRAGRWYENKPLFHILIPTLGDEDLSGFEEVLFALSSCDDQIRDEIIMRSSRSLIDTHVQQPISLDCDVVPECIMIEEVDANAEEIRRCFTNVRKNLFQTRDNRRIQQLCLEKGVKTSIEYHKLREDIPELPENPLTNKSTTWYEFLNPTHYKRMSPCEFVCDHLEPNKLLIAREYEVWLSSQPQETIKLMPTIQNITDGFFGNDDTNFNNIRNKYAKKTTVLRRGR